LFRAGTQAKRGLVGAIVEAAEAGDPIGDEDYLPFFSIFLYAGHENMANFLSGAIHILACHPGEWRFLREHLDHLDTAIEELLRFESPVQFVKLVVQEDLSISGQQISKGDSLLACVAAANRDPGQFRDPDRLDLTRKPNPHLTFGFGALYCIGATL